jgi:hypothetical protein
LHFLDINELLTKSGSSRQVSSPFSDQLFIHQLLKLKPANCYARQSERRFNTMRNMRISMLACSALMLVASLGWSAYTIMGGLAHRQNTLAAQGKTGFYTTRYQIARESLPQTPVEAADLKVAVELAENLAGYKATPLEMIRLVSGELNKYPSIKLGSFEWTNSIDPNIKIGSNPTTANQGVIGYSNVTGSPEVSYKYYQIAVIESRINPFDGNYREGISLINEFAETLRKQPNVFDVSILSLPLDVSSDSSMQGNTNSTRAEALFSLRVVLGIRNED